MLRDTRLQSVGRWMGSAVNEALVRYVYRLTIHNDYGVQGYSAVFASRGSAR